jgi:hypothetical protein
MEIHEEESASEQVDRGGKRGASTPGYQPIENYGIIGDLHTTALVGMDGSLDWLCLPHHDSPSVFAAILDSAKGGRFKISPLGGEVTTKQIYWPDTNVLVTRFFTPDGVGEITDYMPIGALESGHKRHQIVRRVEVVRGTMTFRPSITPAKSTRPGSSPRERPSTPLVSAWAWHHPSPWSKGTTGPPPSSRCKRNSPRFSCSGR